MTMIGISKNKATDLGNKFFHDKYTTVVEDLGGEYLRARNLTQHTIDKLFINSLIDKKEHQAGEYVLGVCVRAGVFKGGLNLSYSGNESDMKKSSYKLLKSIALRKISRMFANPTQHGIHNVMMDIIINDRMNKESDIQLLKLGLNVVSDSLYHSYLDSSKTSCSLAIQAVVQA